MARPWCRRCYRSPWWRRGRLQPRQQARGSAAAAEGVAVEAAAPAARAARAVEEEAVAEAEAQPGVVATLAVEALGRRGRSRRGLVSVLLPELPAGLRRVQLRVVDDRSEVAARAALRQLAEADT